MPFRLTIPFRYVRWQSALSYVLLGLAVHIPIIFNHLPEYLALIFIGAILLADVLATQSPELTAFFIAQRRLVTVTVMTVGIALASLDLWLANGLGVLWHSRTILLQFGLQGAIVGVIVRVLVLAMFARLLRGDPIEVSRALLLGAFAVLVWLAPLAKSHRIFASAYALGFGMGFTLHYLVRHKEHTRAQAARLGRYIVESLGHVKLEANEVEAVTYYAKQRWRKLDALLNEKEDLTTVLAIVKASRLRIKGEYGYARDIIEAKLSDGEPDATLRTFLHLHLALNLADLGRRDQMRNALKDAMECHGDCLLSLVTNGLRTAEDIPLEGDSENSDSEDSRQEALHCIWEALKINDGARPELIARIVGRSVPVTWTFLLDAYAYVLLKARHVRFSKALLTECIYEDPYFSSPYLHLGEWCISEVMRARRRLEAREPKQVITEQSERDAIQANSERSRRVAKLCLNIAIQLEGGRKSLTKRRAGALLRDYSSLLSETP